MKLYDHKHSDIKWQKKWEEEKLYQTPRIPGDKKDEKKDGKKVYVLDMFPYPSGEGLHVGHPKGYIATDIYSRFKRMNGYDVLHPMGWDAFGLPAEQYALKNKVHPKVAVEKNIARYKEQLSNLGLDYDWQREINTTDPSFYKWTQWIFTKMYEKGLAYESNKPINWCPSCKTGLANEDVNADGTCERCDTKVEKKPLRQWVLKITDYADRLIKDLDELTWPEGIKTAQKNWIGRSEGAEFDFKLAGVKNHADGQMSVKVFTTRADTLFGVTFIAISAEMAKTWLDVGWETEAEVGAYVTSILLEQKKENDYSIVPEKTGVFSGVYAVNPATQEKVPVWVANYVMGGVGTGAVMGVPAHDERDYEFAKKYSLPIKQVIAPKRYDLKNPFVEGWDTVERNMVQAIIIDPKNGKYLMLDWKQLPWTTFVGGGIEESEIPKEAALRKIEEEAGIKNLKYTKTLQVVRSEYSANHKKQNRISYCCACIFEISSETTFNDINQEEKDQYQINWYKLSKLPETFACSEWDVWEKELIGKEMVITEAGSLINSEKFSGLMSDIAIVKIIEAFGGKKVVKYKLQDWVFARQRYWGEPFPVVRDDNGVVYMVDESELPVLLPDVEQYEPAGTGESPLAAISSWVNVKGYVTEKGTFKPSDDGAIFTRETNTMPQWAGSSWYYLRFADPHNDISLIDPAIEKSWLPVDVYVGGDHATRHLIYARFWHKFLYDIGVVSTDEPFKRLEFLGFILAEDGRKMSKRWGNVINPDDVVSEYGADTLRVYEMFMAPFEQTASWSTSSIKGSDKFLDRVYALREKIGEVSSVETELHATIKKVTEDIENFKFNTAVSSMMILVNSMESSTFSKKDYSVVLQILAPFAPHITEEVWHELGNKTSIHKEKWPMYDEGKLQTDEVTIAIQVNGKLRGTLECPRDMNEESLKSIVQQGELYKRVVGDTVPKKIIVVKNKIINFVI